MDELLKNKYILLLLMPSHQNAETQSSQDVKKMMKLKLKLEKVKCKE